MKVAVIADTHTVGASRPVPHGAWPYLESADHILHAGDVCDVALLEELEALAPVTAVLGNMDPLSVREWGASEQAEVELEGVRVAMIHDSGPKERRRERLRNRFPEARVVVFGHSHIPWNEDLDGLLLFNPGSPTWPRQAPFTSMGLLWISDGTVDSEIFPV